MDSPRKLLVSSVLVPLTVGIIGFGNVARLPRFETYRTVDILQLIASGMLLGIALASLTAYFRRDRSNGGSN